MAASRPELLLQSGVSAAVERAVEALKRLLPQARRQSLVFEWRYQGHSLSDASLQAGRDGRKSLSDILNAEPDFLDTKKAGPLHCRCLASRFPGTCSS